MDDVALVPRHGIWAMHGDATDRSCRCIDDMLIGEQNGTVGTVSSHRPTDPDGLVAQVRATRRRFPKWQLSGALRFGKAYKQVPGCSYQLRLAIIVMWSVTMACPVFFRATVSALRRKVAASELRKVPSLAL